MLQVLAVLCALANGAAARVASNPAADSSASSANLHIFGVEIGGPEDGFSLTDKAAFESAKALGARSIDLRPVWSVLEPAPGVYDWSTLDTALAHARAVDLPVTITLRFFDDQVPAWFADENMIDQNGETFSGYGFKGVHRSPSYWGPTARPAYLRLVDALVRRYRGNSSICAWQFFYGYNDSFYMGMWNGKQTVYDYSEFSQEHYRLYLRRQKHLSLRGVNERYGASYKRWDELRQPRPLFGELNVTRAWHDFQDYRMWSIACMFDDMDQSVRTLDKRPLIMYYGGSPHFAAHQLSVYDVGLRLLKKHGGMLDVTCFEDPVPAEVGTGIVRSYGVTPMAEAWQVPPPLKDFRRLFFNMFAQGVTSYQLVGSWKKLEASPEEFSRTAEVFDEMADAKPIRAPVAGLISYRSILSCIPARPYINPTLAMIPKLQENQYSLDWHSDMSPLDDLSTYPALLDANSEVLERRVVERLERYVKHGGRLALLSRSGKYVLESGRPDYVLLERLRCPEPNNAGLVSWSYGKGHVLRLGADPDWSTAEGVNTLLRIMEWLQVARPVTATPGTLAAVSGNSRKEVFVALFSPGAEPAESVFTIRPGILDPARHYRASSLFAPETEPKSLTATEAEAGVKLTFAPYELKLLKLSAE